jgi:hypothetical protein
MGFHLGREWRGKWLTEHAGCLRMIGYGLVLFQS